MLASRPSDAIEFVLLEANNVRRHTIELADSESIGHIAVRYGRSGRNNIAMRGRLMTIGRMHRLVIELLKDPTHGHFFLGAGVCNSLEGVANPKPNRSDFYQIIKFMNEERRRCTIFASKPSLATTGSTHA
jgi:hypothetical protein